MTLNDDGVIVTNEESGEMTRLEAVLTVAAKLIGSAAVLMFGFALLLLGLAALQFSWELAF